MKKETAYLLKLNEEYTHIFDQFNVKLGWNKRDTLLKLLLIFKEIIPELENGKELVIQIRNEKSKEIDKEKSASFDLLRNPN